MADRFDGAVAVITGGASGIGFAMAEAFAARGARLVLADIDEPALDAAEAALSGRADVMTSITDVTDAEAVEQLAVEVFERHGQVNILCNNAGVAAYGPLAESSLEEWQWLMDINVWGVVHGVRSFVPRMLESGQQGHVVNTASMSGLVGMLNLGMYCASKFAVVGMSEALARELRSTPIGVTILCPMVVDTKINEHSMERRPRGEGDAFPVGDLAGGIMAPDVVAERVVEAIEAQHLYILTHPEQGPILARRAGRLAQAVPS